MVQVVDVGERGCAGESGDGEQDDHEDQALERGSTTVRESSVSPPEPVGVLGRDAVADLGCQFDDRVGVGVVPAPASVRSRGDRCACCPASVDVDWASCRALQSVSEAWR